MKLRDLVPPEAAHDRCYCACRRGTHCWPLTEADVQKQGDRWDAREFDDELDVMKRHGRQKCWSLNRIAAALSGIMGGPRYEMNYSQESLFGELQTYDRRRSQLLGIEERSRYELAEKAGYRNTLPLALEAQWNRRAPFLWVLGYDSK